MKKFLITLAAAVLATTSANAKTLVAYFSFPINNGKESLDANSGASVVPDSNGKGNAAFIAEIVAKTLGNSADLFEIDMGNIIRVTTKNFLTQFQQSEKRISDWAMSF